MKKLVAMLVAVVLGAGGGVALGLDHHRAHPSTAPLNPLGLGVSQQDLGCTGGFIRIIGSGDTAASLAPDIADNAGDDPHYLRIGDSCHTIYVSLSATTVPEYVAYVGPFATADAPDACATRMSEGHNGDYMTHLRAGNDTFVKCVCVLPAEAAPTLDPKDDTTTLGAGNIWLRSLQGMFIDSGKLPEDAKAGVFDRATEDVVKLIQGRNAIRVSGVVGLHTWQVVRQKICPMYDY